MQFKWLVLLLLVFLTACNGTSQVNRVSGKTKKKTRVLPNAAKLLCRRYHDELREWYSSQLHGQENPNFKKPNVNEFLAEFKRLAAENPESEIAAEAHSWICAESGVKEEASKSLKVMMENHLDSGQMVRVAIAFSVWDPNAELVANIKTTLRESSNRDVRGAATCSLINCYLRARKLSGVVEELEASPEFVRRFGDEGLAYVKGFSIDDLELEKLYVSLAEDYRDVVVPNGVGIRRDGLKLGEFADEGLYKVRNLWPGRKALEISGKDLNGTEFKLSDYRGKIVMLYFWGDWCHLCREQYPHHLALVDRLADKPFALIGVNTDAELKGICNIVRNQNISWRSFWDQKSYGAIGKEWRVAGAPAVFLIDQNGTIRYAGGDEPEVDQTISDLLAEMGHEVGLSDISNMHKDLRAVEPE